MSNTEKLVIRTIARPAPEKKEDLLEWFCDVFDLAGRNDDVEPIMLMEIAGNSLSGSGVTSKYLNSKLELPRSTVIYHLNRFIYSGLVIRKGRKYYLRSNDMASTIEELQSEVSRAFDRLILFAEKLDRMMESDLNGKGRKSR